MISIKKLISNLQQCRDTNITLPVHNESENSKFIQKTALRMRKEELEARANIKTYNTQLLNDVNYTMDTEIIDNVNNTKVHIKDISNSNNSNGNGNGNGNSNSNSNSNSDNKNKFKQHIDIVVPSKSLIVYVENETAQIPEIILNIFKLAHINTNEWYIFGVKNPESFYKSFRFLTRMDFIIKNKNEKKNDIATFKREMALQYETFYKSLNYRKLRFMTSDIMINNLTNIDNYVEYDAIKFTVDYNMCNLIILDIVSEKYIDVKYSEHTLVNNSNNSNNSNTEFIIIIKYANNTYLPLMNSNGTHTFNISILDTINKHFERIVIDKFKEINVITNNINNITINNNVVNDVGDVDSVDDIDVDVVEGGDSERNTNNGDILNCESISVFYNNNISNNKNLITNLVKTELNNTTKTHYVFEEIITHDNYTNNNNNNNSNNNNNNSNNNNSNNDNSNNDNSLPDTTVVIVESPFDILMNNIPIKTAKIKKTQKDKKTTITNPITNPITQPIIKLDDLLNSVVNNTIINSSVINNTTIQKNVNLIDNKLNENENENTHTIMKPINKYNLLDLQMLAKIENIDTQKQGSSGKKINKTKIEMYEEIINKHK